MCPARGDEKSYADMSNFRFLPGSELSDVLVETVSVEGSGTPVARPVEGFPPDTVANLDRALCEELPVGTRFRVSGTLRQRHQASGLPPALIIDVGQASVVVDSIPDDGVRAILQKVKTDNSTKRVRNCRSAFKCDKSWDELVPTNSDSVRHCRDCVKDVYLCRTIGEICSATSEGKCVAVMAASVADHSAQDFVGYVADEENAY
jgi:hypothetical protein